MIIMVTGYGVRDEGINAAANKFVKSLKIGWNPGNTFDAYSDQNKEDEMAYESDWCGKCQTMP